MKRNDSSPDRLPKSSRRRVLSLAAGAITTGLAGCSGVEEAVSAVDSGPDPSEFEDRTIDGAPMLHYDARNTAHAPPETGPTESVGELWTFAGDGYVHEPAVVDDVLYLSSGSGVYALDAVDGSERWHAEIGSVPAAPTVIDGAVYAGSDEGMYALDAADGRERWNVTEPFAPSALPSVASWAVADGTVYVSGESGLAALDASDGSEKWFAEVPRTPTPAVADGRVYMVADDDEGGSVVALDTAEGSEAWRFETNERMKSVPAVSDGVVYVGSASDVDDPYGPAGGKVYAIDAADGTERWSNDVLTSEVTSPAVADGTVYVGSKNANVRALDAETGAKQWDFETEAGGEAPGRIRRADETPAVADGTVYFGTEANAVHAVDGADGTEQWRHDTDESMRRTPVVVDGVVYAGGDETLYALA